MVQLKNVSRSSELWSSLVELGTDGKFSDCRVHCHDGIVNCHKLLLVSCSDLLRDVLSREPDIEDILVPDFSVSSVRCLLSITFEGLDSVCAELLHVLKCSSLLSISKAAEVKVVRDRKLETESIRQIRRSTRRTTRSTRLKTDGVADSTKHPKIEDDIPVDIELMSDSRVDPQEDKVSSASVPAIVLGAKTPLLAKTRNKLDKVTRGKLHTKSEADEIVRQNLNKTILDKKYQCLQCNWKHAKLEVAREHVYNHFGVYLHQCEKCLDLFRKPAHLRRHLDIHQKREEQEEILSGDKIGNYHLLERHVYLPLKRAKQVLTTYYTRDNEGSSNKCKLCEFSSSCSDTIRNHLLQRHLKLNVYKCNDCGEQFSVESDIKKHSISEHGKQFESHDDPEYESHDTEVDVAAEAIADLPLERLFGKKVSSEQGRALRRTHIRQRASDGRFECDLCGFSRDVKSSVSDHVMSVHYNVYLYKCPQCSKRLRNWSRYTLHRATHTGPVRREKPARTVERKPFSPGTGELEKDYHLMTEDVYVGKEDGLKMAREYFFYDESSRKYQCKMCSYQGRHQNVEQHVLALHLRRLHLYRCDQCGKMVRYSQKAFKDHLELHSVGKVACTLCQELELEDGKRFTKASLAAHMKRIHREGRYPCDHCSEVLDTQAHLKRHHRLEHLMGIPASKLEFLCQLCDHTFPRKQQLEWHLKSCQAGRSRSGFRNKISSCLTWLGDGVYQCNFCQQTFTPPRPTASSLPLARKHVVSVHKMNHLRKVKMSWTQGLNSKKKVNNEEVVTVPENDVIIQYYVSGEDITTEEVIIDDSECKT